MATNSRTVIQLSVEKIITSLSLQEICAEVQHCSHYKAKRAFEAMGNSQGKVLNMEKVFDECSESKPNFYNPIDFPIFFSF